MSAFVTTITEGLRYKGKQGHWAWIFHRVSGLGIMFFLVLHVFGMSLASFNPAAHEQMLELYKQPIFAIGELGLAACLVYHAINGARIALLELKPEWWANPAKAMRWSIILTMIFLTPTLLIMAGRSIQHFFGAH